MDDLSEVLEVPPGVDLYNLVLLENVQVNCDAEDYNENMIKKYIIYGI